MGTQGDLLRKWFKVVLSMIFVQKRVISAMNIFFPMEDKETVLLIDSWTNQQALDLHHASSMMKRIMQLREKYDLHMKVERYLSDNVSNQETDKTFIRE